MKETKFIEQNQKKWQRFEELYKSKSNDPEELSELYMDITDDLSYAQTFYKRRTVRVYLNKLAQTVYTGVHKQKGESFSRFIDVWRVSLPLEIYRSRKSLLFALVAFLVYTLIGVATTIVDPDFPRVVLGDYYVNMTIENIQNGNPLKVYEDHDQMRMFIDITTNNMKVAFLTFFVGFFFTIGTHILLFSNGVMLGAFQYFFHAKGLLVTSFLGIWIHGAFEISAIVLAGGAGITAGNGLLFPKSYTRLQSLQLSTKRGLKIMMSLVPFIIAAGFLESYVTANYQNLPEWSKWTLIFVSFGIILFFYVFYPLFVARKHPELINQEEVGNFVDRGDFDFFKIRNVGEIIADSFRMYRFIFAKLARIVLSIIAPIITIIIGVQLFNHYESQQTEYWYDWVSQLQFMAGYSFINMQDYIVFGIWTLLLSFFFTSIYWCIANVNESFNWRSLFEFQKKRMGAVWIGSLFFGLCVLGCLTLPWFVVVLVPFIAPFFFLNGAMMAFGSASWNKNLAQGFKFSARQYGTSLLTIVILIGLTAIIVQPIALYLSNHQVYLDEPTMRDLLDMVSGFIKRVAHIFDAEALVWSNLFRQIIYAIFLLGIIPLYIIAMSFGFFNEREKSEALGLKRAFKKFGKRSNTKETKIDFE